MTHFVLVLQTVWLHHRHAKHMEMTLLLMVNTTKEEHSDSQPFLVLPSSELNEAVARAE